MVTDTRSTVVMKQKKVDSRNYHFIKRVVKAYYSFGYNDLHDKRKTLCLNAVKTAFMSFPTTKLPCGGDAKRAAQNVLPLLEDIFEMPKTGPAHGSSQWVNELAKNPLRATFGELVKFPIVREAFVRKMQETGNADGSLRLQPGEKIPSGEYKAGDLTKRSPSMVSRKSLKAHSTLRFVHWCFSTPPS